MDRAIEHFDLNEAQAEAVKRFRSYHRSCEKKIDGYQNPGHALEWVGDYDDGSLELVCCCGAILHVSEPIYVVVDDCASKTAGVDHDDGNPEYAKWLRGGRHDVAQESLFQSALVTLPDETFEQVRLHPSTTEMHFGLGLYLRNRFLHSGLLWSEEHPDSQSSGALSRLIKYCIPELRGYDLVYDEIESGVLYDAYRYCMTVRGEFPKAELTEHYDILLGAQKMDDANPYSVFEDEYIKEWSAWSDRVRKKRKQFELETLYAIWNFDAIREDLGEIVAKKCEEICLAALHGKRGGFMPSEIAYAMAGFTDDLAMQAFAWAIEECDVADYLPDELFMNRHLALEAVGRSGRLLERAMLFQDDDEVVLAAVANCPTAIKFASERLQGDRHVLAQAASHADSDLIFSDGPMARYNDDDELVGLALDANGANIKYASERIRGDFEFAMRAVTHPRSFYPDASYESLTDKLKQDKRIALVVAKWDMPPGDFPPASLADDDEIGEALFQHDDHFVLICMSRRIKEKYMTDDELEIWGDDPSWRYDADEME